MTACGNPDSANDDQPDMMLSLGTTPYEIQSHIAEYACTSESESNDTRRLDTGSRTARHLCLVSKRFRDITQPILYRTVCVVGRRQTHLLARTLQDEEVAASRELARHVRTLFLSDSYPNMRSRLRRRGDEEDDDVLIMPSVLFSLPRTHEGRMERRRRQESWLAERAQALALFHDARFNVVRCAAPYVRRLTVLSYDEQYGSQQTLTRTGSPNEETSSDAASMAAILRLAYPRLREVTLRNPASFPTQLQMAGLERIHLAGGEAVGGKAGWARVFSVLESSCRNLVRVDISDPPLAAGVVGALLERGDWLDKLSQVVIRVPVAEEGATAVAMERLGMHGNVQLVQTAGGRGRDEVRYSFETAEREWAEAANKV